MKYYIGTVDNDFDRYKQEVFAVDFPNQATPEESGYDSVEGPFDTKEEAEDCSDLV